MVIVEHHSQVGHTGTPPRDKPDEMTNRMGFL